MPAQSRFLLLLAALLYTTILPAHDAPAPGYSALPYSAPTPGNYALPVMGQAADGAVLDSRGHPARLHELYDGRLILLSFIYATCDDANGCPLATHVLRQIRAKLKQQPELAKHLRLLTLSFNPRHDTSAVMAQYAQGFRAPGVDWRFLTTASEAEIQPILRDYGQAVEREVDETGKSTRKYSHLLRVFLIDTRKQIRNVYTISVLHPDLVLADVKTLLVENDARPAPKPPANLDADLWKLTRQKIPGLPRLPVPADNPLTREKIALGRRLFFDRRLSLNGSMSCAMCHVPEQGFTSQEQITAVGIEGRSVRRNSPTIYNVAYFTRLFHDGRESSLENQAWGPLLARNEMGNPSIGFVVDRLKTLPDYRGRFEQAFRRGASMETVGQALASYERALLSGDSDFDRWLFGRQEEALTPAAKQGYALFTGKAGCGQCHRIEKDHALFTDQQLHNTGLGYRDSMKKESPRQPVQVAPGVVYEMNAADIAKVGETRPGDLGLYEITQKPEDRWKYKTPSLRNIALTAPYMHSGSLGSLREVVEFYNRGGEPNENLDPSIRPLGLDVAEIDALVEFLRSLTGNNVEQLTAASRASD